jgi:hypothetical protein
LGWIAATPGGQIFFFFFFLGSPEKSPEVAAFVAGDGGGRR